MTLQSAEARRFVVQSLWLMRLAKPAELSATLDLARILAIEGLPTLPLGMLADWTAILEGRDDVIRKPAVTPLGTLVRRTEDHVLGRLLASATVDRARTAIGRYALSERPRGIAFAVKQIIERLKLSGVELPPAILKEMSAESPESLLREGFDSLEAEPMPELIAVVERIIAAFREAADVLQVEDAIALEQRTALADLGQYVAHRQVLELATKFEEALPMRPVKPLPGRREVPTRIRDEDQYPVGGYASIGTRGSLESLLHSQLAYMETQYAPDLFDVKFVRDELFYYSRDENQFLRRRRAFGFHFDGSLVEARVKDVALPAQRIVMAMALVLAAIRRLSAWLSEDAIHFAVTFDPALEPERTLFEILLLEQRKRGIATVESASVLDESGQSLLISTHAAKSDFQLIVDGPILFIEGAAITFDGDAWSGALLHVLQSWI